MSPNMNNTHPDVQTVAKRNVIIASALYPGLTKESMKNASGYHKEIGQTKRKAVALPPGTELIPMTDKEVRRLRRAHRRNLSYFYVMRKSVCYFMAILLIAYAAVAVLGCISYTAPYTSYITILDNTPWDVRDEEYKDTGISYVDQSVGVGVTDIILGYIDSLGGSSDASAQAAEESEETGDETEEEADDETASSEEAAAVSDINYYTTLLQLLEDRVSDFEPTGVIYVYAFKYTPIALALALVTMLITLFKSLFALRGRRIRRGFGLSAIILLVCAVVAGIGVLGVCNAVNANAGGLSDFSLLGSFFTNTFYGAPYTVAEAREFPSMASAGGLLVPVMLIVPIPVLILSFFSRKRAYYRLFNK